MKNGGGGIMKGSGGTDEDVKGLAGVPGVLPSVDPAESTKFEV